MNVIYKLTKKGCTKNPRFYIGSKKECKPCEVNGELQLIDRRGKVYNSSCSQQRFKEDLKKYGFTVEILEKVTDRTKIFEREIYYINKYKAVISEEYYNLSDALYAPDIVQANRKDIMANKYESRYEYNINSRVGSRRDNKAKTFGYTNYAEFYLDVLRMKMDVGSFKQVDQKLNMSKYSARFASEVYAPLPMFVDNKNIRRELLKYTVDGVSLKKSCDIVGIPLTIGRFIVGDLIYETNPLVLSNEVTSRGEVENLIFEAYLKQDVYSARELAVKFHTSTNTIGRIIHKIAKERLRPNESK